MRAVLITNPAATTTTEYSRDVLVRALRSEVELQVRFTQRRGHAAVLAREAADDGVDLIVTLGGDGTVNEAVNGMLGGHPPQPGLADLVPALAVVPGGSTNVFARALGLPRDWAEATGVILRALREGRRRRVGLGMADERYFTFCAGLGLDAEVIRRVERARQRGRVSTPMLYLRQTILQYVLETDRRSPLITLERRDEPFEAELASVVVQNTAPWTYLGDRPVNPCPEASFDTGLDVLGLRELHVPSTARTISQILSERTDPHGRRVLRLHDVPAFVLRAVRPMAFQLDGDYLGEREKVNFASVADALRVIC